MGQFGNQVGTGRRQQAEVCLPSQIDVRHVVGCTGVPLRPKDRALAQCLHGHRGDELLGSGTHGDLNRGTGFDQQPAQLG